MIGKDILQQILGHTPKEELQDLYNSSDTVEAILKHLEDQLDRLELSLVQYENPSWSHKQAHLNGQRATYALLRKYLVKESKTNG